MHRIAIFSSNNTLVSLWSNTLKGLYNVFTVSNVSELKDISIVIIDAVQIDKTPELIDLFSQTQYRCLVVGENWPENKQINALVHGAAGYCGEAESPKILLQAVASILKGDTWIQRHLVPLVIGTLVKMKPQQQPQKDTNEFSSLLATLSNRENDVANMIKDGESNKVIAAALHISERTVKAHLTSIFKKLNLSDRLHLALYIKEHS